MGGVGEEKKVCGDPSLRAAAPGAAQAEWKVLAAALDLRPHPEGGFYREMFRSGQAVQFRGAPRSAGTAIYYLLAQGAYSAWHRIDADEAWYFHAGAPLSLHVISGDGALRTHRLGNPLLHEDAVFQAAVPAGAWFAAELEDRQQYALVGCGVSPGFEFAHFELAGADDMAPMAARHGDWVNRLLPRR